MEKTSKKASAAVRTSSMGKASVAKISARSQTVAHARKPKEPSKQQQLVSLLLRDEGATLDQMIAATSWLPHTTRAALTGLKKKGYSLSSDKIDGVRAYRAVAPE